MSTTTEQEPLEPERPLPPDARKVTKCRLCGSAQLIGRLSLTPTALANAFQKTAEAACALPKYPLDVLVCVNCGHHQLGVVVNAQTLFTDYVYASGTSKSFRQHFAQYAREICDRLGSVGHKPSVLEIGANDGVLLRNLQGHGFTVLGFEPGAQLAARANDSGVRTWNRFFDNQGAWDAFENFGAFDVWTANNVLAHIDDFVGTLNALHKCTHEESIGVFEVQYLDALLDKGAFDLCYHEHLDYWRLSELVQELSPRTGWQVMDVQLIPTHGGSLRVWVEKAKTTVVHFKLTAPRARPTALLPALLQAEAGLDVRAAWMNLRARIIVAKESLHRLLPAPVHGLTPFPMHTGTVAYGAPAKLTTLLSELQLADHIDYVVDDSVYKQGLYCPGSGLQVHDAMRMRDEKFKPERILLTAWNFADTLVPKLKQMLPGVPIIVPFPNVQVL